ncbi:GBX2 [Branchiostoma lanceolatum]|uniref:GBX2 protein n=1 Tax=Branchiostoma lanceolatum TaxID=7740 RepID=A0A8J9ZST5_BRALA|nr:GBX2 [Branchiostoma lanceolatum]
MLSFSVEAILSKPSSHGRDRWEPTATGDREHTDRTHTGRAPWRSWADPGYSSVQPPWMYVPNPATFRPSSAESFTVTSSPSSSSSDSQGGDSAHRSSHQGHLQHPGEHARDETEVDVDDDVEGNDSPDPAVAEGSPEDSGRRQRRLFSGHQVMELETRFLEKNYLSRIERICLANALNLSETQVKTWFQNRRTKARRKHLTGWYWGRWPGGYRVQPGLTYGPPDDTMRAAIEDLIRRYEDGQVETRLTH